MQDHEVTDPAAAMCSSTSRRPLQFDMDPIVRELSIGSLQFWRVFARDAHLTIEGKFIKVFNISTGARACT